MSTAYPMMRACLFAVLIAASPPGGGQVPGGAVAGDDGVGGIEYKDGAVRASTLPGSNKGPGGDVEVLGPANTGDGQDDAADAWTDLGGGLAGSAGTPEASATGTLVPGDTIQLEISDLPPGAPVVVVVGTAAVWVPLAGGTLIPAPELVLPTVHAGADGRLSLSGSSPQAPPVGVTLYVQAWVLDAGAPAGLSASNAVSVTTP